MRAIRRLWHRLRWWARGIDPKAPCAAWFWCTSIHPEDYVGCRQPEIESTTRINVGLGFVIPPGTLKDGKARRLSDGRVEMSFTYMPKTTTKDAADASDEK